MDFVEPLQEDKQDRGEIRQVHSISHASIKATGVTQCLDHEWKILSENEVYCTKCPTALIVNPETIKNYDPL